MDPKIIKKTQDSLGKIIKKPPLTEKLLSKPPFRFLHDIVTEIIRTTDFMKGLFTPEEMDSKNVTSKEAKITFLNKVIECVCAVTGERLPVRPNKVIAGHEPEHTNALLQTIATCIRKKVPYEDAVSAVLSGKIERVPSKHRSSKSLTDNKQAEAAASHKEEKRKSKHDSAEKSKEKGSDHKRHSSSKAKEDPERNSRKSKSETEETASGKTKSQEKLEKEKALKEQEREKRHKERKRQKEEKEREESQSKTAAKEHEEADQAPATTTSRGPRPASAKGQRRKPSQPVKKEPNEESSDEELVPVSRKPDSTRPGAPKIKQRVEVVHDEIDSGAPHRTAPIIVDNQSDEPHSDDDDDAQFVVKQEAAAVEHSDDIPSDGGVTTDTDDEHGGLVKKILKTKQELEQSAAGSHGVAHHTEIERSTISAQQKKEREMVAREIEELRNSVQKLCQSVAPLAKIIDYIQEDMDSMQNELSFWKNENQQHALQLKEEEINTQRSIEPLHHELHEMEQSIVAYRNQMAATKANIIRNDEKIRKMVVAVATRA